MSWMGVLIALVLLSGLLAVFCELYGDEDDVH